MFIKLTDKDGAPIYINKNTIISMIEEKDLFNFDSERIFNGVEFNFNGKYDATKLTCGVNGARVFHYVKETPDEINNIKGY